MAQLRQPTIGFPGQPDPSQMMDVMDEEGNVSFHKIQPQVEPQQELLSVPGAPTSPVSTPGGNKETPRERGGDQSPTMPSPESRLGGMSGGGGNRATPMRPRSPSPVAAGAPSPMSPPPPGPPAFMPPQPRELIGEAGPGRGLLGKEGGLLGGGIGAPGMVPEETPTDLLLLLTQLLNQNG